MASEARAKMAALLAAAGLAALAFGAGRAGDAPRVLVLCGLAAVVAVLVLWRSLAALAALRRLPAPEPRAVLNVEQQSLVDNALALEARLEHAPVALFGIDGGDGEEYGRVLPLNANARKLIAPGRASDAGSTENSTSPPRARQTGATSASSRANRAASGTRSSRATGTFDRLR
jgi:hypothetical protein